jgi:hypothetical protein
VNIVLFKKQIEHRKPVSKVIVCFMTGVLDFFFILLWSEHLWAKPDQYFSPFSWMGSMDCNTNRLPMSGTNIRDAHIFTSTSIIQ